TLFYNQTPTAQVAVGAVRQVLTAVAGSAPEPGNPLTQTWDNVRDFIIGNQSNVATNVIERPVNTRQTSFIDYFVPGILAMSIMNSGIIGLATSFVTYRERGILRRIRVTPFPLSSFLLAKVLAQMIQIVIQALI